MNPAPVASLLHLVALWLVAINLLTVLVLRTDKDRARTVRRGAARRIPETNLLALALMGGTPGAYFARRFFRHKASKQPFSAQLHCIAALQLAGLAALAWHFARG